MRPRPLAAYEGLRRMALGKDRSLVLRWWEANRALLLCSLAVVLTLLVQIMDMAAQIEESNARLHKVSAALLREGCMLHERASAYFIAGANERMLDDALMSVASQVFELKEGWRIARQTAPFAGAEVAKK